jgi:hypothetical protein
LARDDAEFPGSVATIDLGADTLVTIGGHSIMPVGVNGTGPNMVTQQDFLLACSGSRQSIEYVKFARLPRAMCGFSGTLGEKWSGPPLRRSWRRQCGKANPMRLTT